MSAERYSQAGKDMFLTTAKAIPFGVLAGGVGVAGIVTRQHRELTHRSIELPPIIQKIMDLEQRTIGVGEPTIWAAVHRIHHQIPDASLFRFYQIARAVQWLDKNPEHARNIDIPEQFSQLDPGVDSFAREDVIQIGKHAIQIMKDRLGGEYRDPESYSPSELKEILNPNPEKPTYWYPPFESHTGEYTQDQLAQRLLMDPHSGVLMPPRNGRTNGVRGVARSNVYLYKRDADLFRDRPDLKPADLISGKEKDRKKPVREVVAGFVIPSAAVLLSRRKFNSEDLLIAAVAGSALNGARIGTEILGGNTVNSLGHSGVLDRSAGLISAALSKKYQPKFNPEDGTYSTDTSRAGVLGRVIKWLTLDEANQDVHHKYPEKIAYTLESGLKAWYDAPFGSFVEYLAKSKVPMVKEGKGFGVPKVLRPDMTHEAVLLIQKKRVEQYAAQH